ncbi:MAG: nucleotidyltransferase domain-containing protein, partial [Syntrophales bacterium]
MKNIYFRISMQANEEIITHIWSFLEKLPDLLFAYVHGSFIMDEKFRDIDVAIYLKAAPTSPLQMEIDLETELANVINKCPVDVRILNDAPLSSDIMLSSTGSLLSSLMMMPEVILKNRLSA